MESLLISWLFSLKEDEKWMSDIIRDISNNNNHITIKSLKTYFPLNQKNKSDEIQQFMYKIQPLFEESSKNINLPHTGNMIYKLNDATFNRYKGKNNHMYFICLEILKNNKKKLIKKDNNNEICSNSNTSSGGSLFLNKIWRNHSIKIEILYHCKIFKNHRFPFRFDSISKLNQYKFKDYLNYVQLNYSNLNTSSDGSGSKYYYDYLEFNIPPNVRILQIDGYITDFIKPSSIPSTVKTLIFDELDFIRSCGDGGNGIKELDRITITSDMQLYYTNIPNGVESVGHYQLSYLQLDFIPQSLASPTSTNQPLLPNTLKSIKIVNQDVIRTNENIKDIIQINSLPSSIESLSFNITLNHRYINFNVIPSIIPNGLTDLCLENLSLVLGANESIKKGILPSQLKRLNICGYYGTLEKNVLPSTLISLTLSSRYIKTIKEGCLPKSLEYLSFRGSDCLVPINYNEPSGISSFFKSLLVSKGSSNSKTCGAPPILIKGSIPIGLKTLKLSKYQCFLDVLVKDIFTEQHKSLTKLSLESDSLNEFKDDSFIKLIKFEIIQSKINNWELNTKFIPSSVTKITYINTGVEQYQNALQLLLPITKTKIFSHNNNPDFIPPFVKNIKFINSINSNPTNQTIQTFTLNDFKNNNIKSITIHPKINIYRLPKKLETLICSNNLFLSNCASNKLKYLKKLIISDVYTSVELENQFPNLELLVIFGYIKVVIKNNDLSKLKKIIISNLNINFLNDNPTLQSIIQVENFSTIKQIKHLL